MARTITAKTLRRDLARILDRARRGEQFTVLYRNRPVCRIVPLEAKGAELGNLEDDPAYRAGAVGRSKDGKTAQDHDETLYGITRR